MSFDFDTEVNKFGINSIKWEFIFDAAHNVTQGDHAHPKHGTERLLPLWVADMDFRCPPAVVEAVVERPVGRVWLLHAHRFLLRGGD